MTPTELDFTLDDIVQEIPVKVPTDKGVEDYKLVSLSGQDATKYQNARANCIRFDRDGNPVGFQNIADLAPMLVSLCLKRLDGSAVSKNVVGLFPHKVLQKLFTVAQEMNDLNQETRYSEALQKVFSLPDSPVNVEEVRQWLKTQNKEDKDIQSTYTLFKETDEELGKNSQSGTTDGSM
jgi:hypothetical protein